MPRQAGTVVQNNFVRGLITESTGLNFPEEAVEDCDNVVFEKTGEVRRRYGVDYEPSYAFNQLSGDGVITLFNWETPGNSGGRQFVVKQIGRYVYFYELGSTSLSSGYKSFSIDLYSHVVAPASATAVSENKASFSSGNGFLFIAHRHCEPLYVEYDPDTDTISEVEVTIFVRDFEGVDDGLDVNERPSDAANGGGLTAEHEYNLLNQGWGGNVLAAAGNSVVDVNPLWVWSGFTFWPSNADVWFYMKDGAGRYNVDFRDALEVGNSPAAKGHFIHNAFNVQQVIDYEISDSQAASIPLPDETNGEGTIVGTKTSNGLRPEFTEFYTGRVWWSGVRHKDYASQIYFSKIIESEDDFGVCHPVNDPTSEVAPDLLPSDGGVVVIPDISEVVFMKVVEGSLVVFATNGVWTISGDDRGGFQADSYLVSKISEIGCLSSFSFVSAEGIPIWWNATGIYTLVKGSGNNYTVTSLTNTTIKEFYENIPRNSKTYAQGTYDTLERTVTWAFRSASSDDITDNMRYNRALTFNIDTQAFYPFTFSLPTDIYINAPIAIEGNAVTLTEEDVTDSGGVVVTTTGGEDITSDVENIISFDSTIKFLTTSVSGSNRSYTFSQDDVTAFEDFSSFGTAQQYSSYFDSGYALRGESHRNFSTNYATFTSKTESGSSFYVLGKWNYSNSQLTNKNTTRQQGYNHKPNTDFSSRKLKFRGKGTALQIRVESDNNNPFYISGWSVLDTVESRV